MKHTICLVVLLHIEFTEAEITQGNVPGVIKKDIFGFEVSVDNIESVKTLQSTQKLCGVKPGPIDVEFTLPLQMVEKLASVHKCQDEI